MLIFEVDDRKRRIFGIKGTIGAFYQAENF